MIVNTNKRPLTKLYSDDGFGTTFIIPKDVKNNALLGHLEKGVLYLNGEVNEEMAEYVRDALMLLTFEPPPNGELLVKITSPGGSAAAGFEIHDLLMLFYLETGIKVRGLVIGEACSAAAMFLLQGCIIRQATENTTIMCHNCLSVGVISEHNIMSLGWRTKIIRELENVKEKAVTVLTRRTGKTEREVLKMLAHEKFMTAKEALEFGLLDGVLGFSFKDEKEHEERPQRRKMKKATHEVTE